jgi:hypothetical protein
MSSVYRVAARRRGRDGTTLHPRERLLVESRKEPAMFPMFILPPEFFALDPELPPLPVWWTVGLAGAATLATVLAWTLS